MDTIPLSLNGRTDLPPGKIANVVTFLERAPSAPTAPDGHPDLSVQHVTAPTAAWYRDLYWRIGGDWLWFSAMVIPDAQLAAILADPATTILALMREHDAVGLAELSFATPGEVQIVTFGVVPPAIGTSAAATLMAGALAEAFRPGIKRVWLRTCTFDHPAAIRFYLKHGFRAYKYAIEVLDDPRLQGLVPAAVAPHVPLIARPRRWRRKARMFW
jgi:GNAT superfamily N-acetyltransferase